MKTSKRVVMRIELTPAAKAAFSEIAAKLGMTQVAISSRVVEWLVNQPVAVQLAILQPSSFGGENTQRELIEGIFDQMKNAPKSA
ncbi:MAG TPA: hypothetical protein VHI52_10090 [Verrucomicrobiae bacterium]|nr:hypothetical protein [Verrucomicrobiae bacterium]